MYHCTDCRTPLPNWDPENGPPQCNACIEKEAEAMGYNRDECHWCGMEGTLESPLEDTIVSPPVDGYPVETGRYHKDCAREAARSMVE